MLEHGGIDAAEVDVRLQVAVLEIGQAGSRADQAAANGAADQEHRRGRAVVRPVGGVLGDAPAELAEDQDGRAVRQTRTLQVGLERPQRAGQLLQHPLVVGKLTGVRVIALAAIAVLDVVDARRRSRP